MIYFVQPVDGGPVKIGTTENFEVRLKELAFHYGVSLSVLATLPGGREEEKAIHERFTHLRFGRTEQFRPASDLMAFIGKPLLVAADPDTVEAIQPQRAVTIVNLKGSLEERAFLTEVSRRTGVPVSVMVRRGVSMWAKSRGLETLKEWEGE